MLEPMRAPSSAIAARCASTAVVLALLCSACSGDICNRNNDDPPTNFRDGLTSTSGLLYMTSEVDQPYLDFPSGKSYRLFHDLDSTPSLVVPYVSFSPAPMADGSGFTISPGNQTVVHAVTDQYIEVENDTCTDFFLRVVASTDSFDPAIVDGPTSDAGVIDGGT